MKLDVNITDIEIKEILKTIRIIIDNREKKNNHILEYFEKKKINYISRKLQFGDYSAEIKIKENYFTFENQIVIERKQNLNELSGNFTQKRKEFESELLRKTDAKFILLIENNSFSDLIFENYNTKYNSKSFLATLLTFENRYNFHTIFEQNNKLSGLHIYYNLYYFIREKLKN